jgi:NAD(P)-dependent dehydrogenase (short-subunit alcohol dehydrogenase family)
MNALSGLARQAAAELSPYGIRVYSARTGGSVIENVFGLLEKEQE